MCPDKRRNNDHAIEMTFLWIRDKYTTNLIGLVVYTVQ